MSPSPLTELVQRLARQPGATPLACERLAVIRVEAPFRPVPVVYEPCVCVVLRRAKHAYLGEETYTYDAENYLVLSVPLPLECEIREASPESPYLALKLDFDLAMLSELVAQVDGEVGERPQNLLPGLYVSALEERLTGALVRLVQATEDPVARSVLAEGIEREVLFELLRGPQAASLRAACERDARQARVARAIRFVHANLGNRIDVAAIASAAAMSPSTLHEHFKAVTSESPLAYLKKIRLHQARRLLLHDHLSAGEAAHRVGYGSPSQFSREFKRLFGQTPSEAGATGA